MSKVVVIGHGYTSRLGLIRSLGEIGCEITVIVMVFYGRYKRFLHLEGGKPIDCYSKYVKNYYYCRAKDENELINLLVNRCACTSQKVVIIPDSDFSAAVIDRNQMRLKDSFLFPHVNNKEGAVEYWMHKSNQKKLAKEIGLNVTSDCIVEVQNHRYNIPENIQYPCFTKPLMTVGGGKGFLKRCDGEKELCNVLNYVCTHFKADIKVLVEEYMIIDKEYALVGFSNGKDVIIPGIIEFVANSQSHFGIARKGVIKPNVSFESIIDSFKKYVQRIGFCGLFDIDFYESKGKIYFGEMNLRYGGSGYAYTAMGVNLPAMMVNYLTKDDDVDGGKVITRTATFVNERMFVDDWYYGYLSRHEMRKAIESADIRFVYHSTDQAPSRAINRYINLLRIKIIIKRIKDKIHNIFTNV